MPVIEHPVHEHGIRNADYRYGCHNRGPYKETLVVQDGWENGTRHGVIIPFRMSRACRYDRSLSDSGCAGCYHSGSGERYVEEQEEAIRAPSTIVTTAPKGQKNA